jgi:NADPH:quinone reductase-like Zn-dependent oxidoreductase
VLVVDEIAQPEPAPGEVLVRVRLRLSGVNPTDCKARASREPEFPFQVPNKDGVGVVEAVGPGVDEARAGERVWVYFAAWRRQWGTAAQWTVLPNEQAVPPPAGASDELGASLGIPALTVPPEARQAVIEVGAALRDRALTTLPVHRRSLQDIADAHDAVGQGTVGKVVVEIP